MVSLEDEIHGTRLDLTMVRQLLDSPSNTFLKDATVRTVLTRTYNWVVEKIDVNDFTGQSIADAIYSMTVWQLYLVYVESISEYFTQQAPNIIMERADDFRKVAVLYLDSIGIAWPLDKDGGLDLKDITMINAKYGYSPVAATATLTEVYD